MLSLRPPSLSSMYMAPAPTASVDGLGYRYKIDYKQFITAECNIKLPSFKVGEFEWTIECCPQGHPDGDDRFVAILLELVSGPREVTIPFEVTFITENRQKMWSAHRNHTFTNGVNSGFFNFVRRSELHENCKFDGHFFIICTLASSVMWEQSELLKDIRMLKDNDKMTDCSFSVGDEIFKAHRVMMGARSEYFRAQLYGGLAEQEMKVIPIKDVEPDVFRTLIDYVYTNFIPESAPFDLIKGLLVAADRYHIKDLRVKCEENLLGRLSLDKAVDCLILADKHGFSAIKTVCLNLLTDPENSRGLYLNQEYCDMVHDYPALFAEVKEKAKSMIDGLGDTADEVHTITEMLKVSSLNFNK
ncbi:hypothetical protein LUZ63_016984 [Rhynchospora breviuscula]|uniref:BTB domain-containing protein n=1 Tax=Rhynchospora breviuscula TaxID=2022672 RepID=A0A9Q0C1L0_9POAL|nr:hypothetical protein LUZ63_016984 [Rhynchospora breviuscula]